MKRRGGRTDRPPSTVRLRDFAHALLEGDLHELPEDARKRCATELAQLLEQAAAWVEHTRPGPKGRPSSLATWAAVMMVVRLRTKGLPDWKPSRQTQPYIDSDAEAIAAVVGARKGVAFERVRRKLWDWRNGKRPRFARLDMKDFNAVLDKLPLTHRIK